jgi:hypothetical protein
VIRTVVDLNAPIDEQRLKSFEDRHDLGLPEAYRRFLLQHNGGQPVPAAFPIRGFPGNPVGVLQAFFGLDSSIKTLDLDETLLELDGVAPSGIVPIGCTGTDDFVCLDLRAGGSSVVFWDRKPFWGSGIWSEGDVYLVADGFESFMEELHDFDFDDPDTER